MFASLLTDVLDLDYLVHSPWMLIVFAFQVWMFVDAARRQEWIWAIFIFIGFGLLEGVPKGFATCCLEYVFAKLSLHFLKIRPAQLLALSNR